MLPQPFDTDGNRIKPWESGDWDAVKAVEVTWDTSTSVSLDAMTPVMSVQDRIQEHAVLQPLGLRPSRIFRLVVAESMLVCKLGGLLGTAIALTAFGLGGLLIGSEGVMIAFRPSPRLATVGVNVSLGVGVVGFFPAIQAARVPIATALRQT